MVDAFVEYLIRNGALEEKYKEDSIYGLTVALEKIIVYSVFLCIAFLTRKLMEGVVFLIPFLVLRQTTGGFHAKTRLGCLMGSGITLLVALEITSPLADEYLVIFCGLLVLSVVCILCFAPVNHPNLMLTKEEIQRHRYWSRGVLTTELFIIIVGYLLHMWWQQYIMMAIIICAVFIWIAKMFHQEVKESEDNKDKQYT